MKYVVDTEDGNRYFIDMDALEWSDVEGTTESFEELRITDLPGGQIYYLDRYDYHTDAPQVGSYMVFISAGIDLFTHRIVEVLEV